MNSNTPPDSVTYPDGSIGLDGKDCMYDRLGHIVRQLHESLRALGYDRSLTAVVTEVADATDRLEYIATLTERAANTVLNTVDEAIPIQDKLIERARVLESRCRRLCDESTSVETLKMLAEDGQEFARTVGATAEAERNRLIQIMMAQDFQDITGQIIRKVVEITQKLERELAHLLADNAPCDSRAHSRPVTLLAGPDVPAEALAQTDVDDLLAGLGF